MKPNYVFNGFKKLHKGYLDYINKHHLHDCHEHELSKKDNVGIDFLTTAEFIFLIVRMLIIIILMSATVGLSFYLFVQIQEWVFI